MARRPGSWKFAAVSPAVSGSCCRGSRIIQSRSSGRCSVSSYPDGVWPWAISAQTRMSASPKPQSWLTLPPPSNFLVLLTRVLFPRKSLSCLCMRQSPWRHHPPHGPRSRRRSSVSRSTAPRSAKCPRLRRRKVFPRPCQPHRLLTWKASRFSLSSGPFLLRRHSLALPPMIAPFLPQAAAVMVGNSTALLVAISTTRTQARPVRAWPACTWVSQQAVTA